jgi:N6-adenosine-specific RNA methylase IME4
MIPQALELVTAWGFTYKTIAFYWAKLNRSHAEGKFTQRDFFTGMGYWTRANPEQCILATRGRPVRRSMSVRKLIISPRREHSRKPDEAYERIEQLVPGPYLDLFGRASRPNWTTWGDQPSLFDQGSVGTRRWTSGRPGKRLA